MLRIAIADDEPNIVELIKRMCDYPSVEVVGEARNGMEMIEILRAQRPDMLITDVRMPGMNGLELIEKARYEFPELDIVIISGYRVFDYVRSALKFGVQDFLLKPIDEDELHKVFEQALEKRENNEQQNKYIEDVEKKLMTSLLRLRKDWLLKVVRHKTADKNFTSELFESDPNDQFCIVILKADSQDETRDHLPYITTMLERIGGHVARMIQDRGSQVIYACDESRVYFLLSFSSGMPSIFRGKTENGEATLSDYLTTEGYKYAFLKLFMGIGESVGTLDEILDSYNTAAKVIDNRMDPALSMVTLHGRLKKIHEDAKKYSFTVKDRDQLSMLAETVDSAVVINYFNQTLDRYIAETGYFGWIYDFANAVVQILRHVLINKGMIDEETYPADYDIEDLIDNSGSVEVLKEQMAGYITHIIEKVKEFKENNLSRPIRLAQEYVAKHYAGQITLQDVANNVYLSANYLSTAFKAQTGITFLDYLTRVRMEEAKKLLRNSLMNISEISHAVGYLDEKYFSGLFSKTIGVKPVEYRKFHS